MYVPYYYTNWIVRSHRKSEVPKIPKASIPPAKCPKHAHECYWLWNEL